MSCNLFLVIFDKMFHKSIFKTIYLLFFLTMILTFIYYFFVNIAKADPLYSQNGENKIVDFGPDFGDRQLSVAIEERGKGKITLKKSLSSYCRYDLSGFEETVTIGLTLKISQSANAVEIFGPVGAHSENRQYFILDSNLCPKPLAFVKNNNLMYNVYSDQPSFKVEDFNHDDWQDIAAEYRNYDENPLIDGTRDIYLFDPKNLQFTFLRTENYQQESICPECQNEVK